MEFSDKQELTEFIREANAAEYLAVAAILCSGSNQSGRNIADGRSRGDFKRAIKILRGTQAYSPLHSTTYEAAIAHIRREWLHREVPA